MISVVIPLYNKNQSIYSTLQSVCEQTYTEIEIIVVDDGSTDNSADVVESYDDTRIRLIRQTNKGVCAARNRGIREAKSEYIAFLDADDIWDKHYLYEQVRLIHDFPDAAMWGINFAEMSEGKLIRKLETALPNGYRGYVENYFVMKDRISDLFCSSSVIVQKDVFDKIGYFDERIKYSEDNDVWWRIIAISPVVFYDRYMVFYRYDAENRALNRHRRLVDFLPYYISKYQAPIFKSNHDFYHWVNRWAAWHIRNYYFSKDVNDRKEACVAVKSLDYSVIPLKYRFLYGLPYPIAKILHILDKLYHHK